MATRKASGRPYTGFDGIAGGTTAGLQVLIRVLERETRRGLWNNGAWGIRDKKGKPGQPSVHATGRAVDMSWRNVEGHRGDGPNAAWRAQPYRSACNVIEVLIAHADAIGLELVIDYQAPLPHGRAWRCDRGRWKTYQMKTVNGIPGDWFHIEISPRMAARPDDMKAALDKAFPPNPPSAP